VTANSDPIYTPKTDAARERVARLERQLGIAHNRSESVTAGGLSDYDPAVLSGIRRKPNRKADARRFAAYDREAGLWRDLELAQRDLAALEAVAARDAAEATAKAEFRVEDVRPGGLVRDRHGWHKVVRVSAKSVTVESGYSWTDRIVLDKVLEARPGGAA